MMFGRARSHRVAFCLHSAGLFGPYRDLAICRDMNRYLVSNLLDLPSSIVMHPAMKQDLWIYTLSLSIMFEYIYLHTHTKE
ncbi:hypothetical protein BO78DRAFT_33686 [Aspergillus sclerotiicarbonarius CBS 121057]|uniref:Uncharacterized protein n=1 Tax=Aspergillus sclerotiicarbonarius (strain CBS 121057 / IBT 28362) TaxID=1448318 RepID=A0A319E2W7_ASPSB|nr:hypothetical protein BO78DRAFT_33686 [Aspergillus sclerotiicarbonarius CBS 121057]